MTAANQYCNQDGKEDFGDFVRNEDEEMDLEEVAEPWDRYDKKITSDVFYPIRLGDLINERYLVEHKLGSGGFSTVWMANDQQNSRDVALKIMFAGESGESEIRLQDEIVRNVRDASSHFVTYLETFLLPGDGCHHTVQVFPLMGPCLYCPNASESLHEAGIVHRDLNERNCMSGMQPLHLLPRTNEPVDDLWKEGELVGPANISQSLQTQKFYLSDFGLAKKLSDPVTPRGYPPLQYCSPDRLHRQDPSPACDMWNYMILFSELYLGNVPFSTFFNGGIIGVFVLSLGPLPEEWKGLYTHPESRDSWYDHNQTPDPKWTLESRIASFCPDADPVERSHVLSIMSRVFTYDPAKRLTATQLLRDPSFRAIMENHGC
ncbi:kinase domain-containing protein [Aspergillus eucalypticola CBS 122712]|uniref:Kinase domain-containing protein n=1 Tax=Aspergillus eucalypticola (strain CBS 122712 / IBT 29274) TaxID=1448314 RepID=A0A317VUW0_ASPEC|nr:kinase domain-containing protein [Aspergillus eucalypticola CBS 122712]PWY76722.1 kinase domain-containing protein [Aspergillus eucalypticola CBS 122712]